MSGILSSARMRRRLAWTGAFAAVAGGVAGLILAFPSPGKQKEDAMTTIPGDVVKEQKPRAFNPSRGQVLATAREFVLTAVRRKHTADSWNLLAPSLRRGFTKKSWARGDIPVPPYPAYAAKWRVSYSFAKEIDLQVALYARPKTKVAPVVFDLTLNRFVRQGHVRWLVSSFLPAPSASGNFGSSSTSGDPLRPGNRKVKAAGPVSSATWLLIPAAIFGLLLLVLAIIGVRGWRSSRLYRAYFRERQISSSRPS